MKITRSKLARQNRLDRGRRQPSIYSRTQQDTIRRDYKKSFLMMVLGLLIVGLFYLIFLSPLFKIEKIELSEIKYQERAKILRETNNFKDSFFLNNNLIAISGSSLEKKLRVLPGIKSVNISKKYPNTLVINIIERAPALVWQSLDHKYLVDDTGMIWADYEEKYKDIPIVIDTKNLPTEIGKKPVSSEFSKFVTALNIDFYNITGAKITKMEVVDTTTELKVYSDSTWYAYFDTTRTAKNELLNLNRVLGEIKKTNKKKSLEYVDLRINDKVFYK